MSHLALLFDLDGTLIDSIGLLRECMQSAFAASTRAPSVAEWTAGIGTPLRTQLSAWCDDDDDMEALVRRYREYQDLHLERLTAPFPGAGKMLAWARGAGHATALVTSKGMGMTQRSLEHVGLAKAFDTIVTVEQTEHYKPHPAPVHLALERLGLPPGRALFVGDSTHDMHSGRAAGAATAAALWGPFSRAELATAHPTYWMQTLSELPDVVATMLARRSNLPAV